VYEIWKRSADHDGWYVGHYILMPDHLHFFARPEIGARRMADWVQMWKSVSSRRIAPALAIKPPMWQAEYFDRYLRSTRAIQKNGATLNKTRFRLGLSRRSKHGRIAGQYMI
jgi:hypothetical protein